MTQPKDFFLEWDKDPNEGPKKQSVEEMKETLMSIYEAQKGKKKKGFKNPFKKRSKEDES